MQNTGCIVNRLTRHMGMLISMHDQRGMALVIALMVMVVVGLLGIMFLRVSMTESTISANEVDAAMAFHLSEAGIEHAKKALEGSNLSALLDGTDDIFGGPGKGKGKGKGKGLGTSTVNLAGGTYTVGVRNNIDYPETPFEVEFPRGALIPADPNGDPSVDSDGIVVVTSTGTVQGVEQSIEMVVQLPTGGLPFGSMPGAVVQVSNGWNDMDVGGTVSGLPPGPESESGGGTCPDQAGFVFRGTSGVVEGGGTWEGSPAEREYDGGPPSGTDNPMFDDPHELVTMVEEWMNDPTAVTITGQTPPAKLGTAANPQITVWDPAGSGSSDSPPPCVTGYGILIIDQDNSFNLQGLCEFHGLIVSMQVHSGGGEAFELTHGTLYGALLAVNDHYSPSGEATEIGVHGATVKYSCDALANYADVAAGGGGGVGNTVTVLSWRQE